jgi:hypothetical protein
MRTCCLHALLTSSLMLGGMGPVLYMLFSVSATRHAGLALGRVPADIDFRVFARSYVPLVHPKLTCVIKSQIVKTLSPVLASRAAYT